MLILKSIERVKLGQPLSHSLAQSRNHDIIQALELKELERTRWWRCPDFALAAEEDGDQRGER